MTSRATLLLLLLTACARHAAMVPAPDAAMDARARGIDERAIFTTVRKAIFIGVKNGFPIGADITNLRTFHELGGRYTSLAHNGHGQLSDSNTGERDGVWRYNGLSPLGKQVIVAMNRLGMMIDSSHPSKE